jgi:tRNA(Arg) A34 adenosine deaminase TadA
MSLIQNCPHCDSSRKNDRPSRRAVIVGLTAAAALPTVAAAAAAPAQADDERFMRIAIDEARRADFPFGAVIVRDGKILARGRNLGRTTHDPTAHGEMVAIRRALANHGPQALKGATIYTSGEPCAMCMGAILWCGFGRLVFAASVEQLATPISPPRQPTRRLPSPAACSPTKR